MAPADLHEAVKEGNIAAVQRLLSQGLFFRVNVNQEDKDGLTPLHWGASRGHQEIVQLLIDAKANVEAVNKQGHTPLHTAASTGTVYVAKILIGANANLEAVDQYRQTPLHFAASGGNQEVVKVLINANANIDAVSKHGKTPLHYAVTNNRDCVVRQLINAKANVGRANKLGCTSLHIAAMEGNVVVTELLIDANANVEATDTQKCTPLHCAATSGSLGVVRLLLKASANIDAVNKQGTTPLDCAVRSNRVAVVCLLREAKAKASEKAEHRKFHSSNSADSTQEPTPDHADSSPIHKHSTLSKLIAAIQRGDDEDFDVQLDLIIKKAIQTHSSATLPLPSVATSDTASTLQSPLFAAASSGDVSKVRALIELGALLDVFDSDGLTPLIHAAQNGHDAVVSALIDGGVNIELKSAMVEHKKGRSGIQKPMSALQYACTFNQVSVVQMMLDAGASVDVTNGISDNAPLLIASRMGSYGIVKMLIDHELDVQVRDSSRRTALHWAAGEGNESVVELLINAGAGIEATNADGITPLMLAAANGHFRVVRLLLESGADTQARDKKGQDAQEIATIAKNSEVVAELTRAQEMKNGNVSADKASNRTMEATISRANKLDLKTAAQIGDLAVIQIRMLAGAYVNVADERGWTPLMHAAFFGHEKVVDALLAGGAQFQTIENEDNRTALYLACSFGHERIVDALINAGANVNVQNKSGCTPLMLAAYKNNSGLLKMLLSHGANIETVDYKQRTALLRACAFGRPSMARLLLDHDVNVEAVDSEGMTPLLVCAQKGYTEIVCMLIDARANTKVVGKDRMTPLHWSARNGHIDIVKVLIAAKVSIDSLDELGRTPLGWAAFNGHSEVVRILVDGGANVLVKDKSHQMPMGLAFKNGHVDLYLELLGAGMLQRNQCTCHQSSHQSCNTKSFPSLARVGSILAQADGVRIQSNFKSDGNGDAHVNEASDSKPRADAIEYLPSQIGGDKANLKSGDDVTSDILSASLSAPVGRDASVATTDSWISVDGLSSRTNSLVREREEFVFVDNESSFPIHSAVVRSNGDLNEFEQLTNGIDLRTNTTSVTMRMKKVRVKTARISINAAEYAFALGYLELGDYLVQELRQIGQVHEEMVNTPNADSVTLSKYDEMAAIAQAVRFSQGRVSSFQAVAGDLLGTATLGATLEAEIVRSETISEHTWLPVQLAAALQYAEITMRLVAM